MTIKPDPVSENEPTSLSSEFTFEHTKPRTDTPAPSGDESPKVQIPQLFCVGLDSQTFRHVGSILDGVLKQSHLTSMGMAFGDFSVRIHEPFTRLAEALKPPLSLAETFSVAVRPPTGVLGAAAALDSKLSRLSDVSRAAASLGHLLSDANSVLNDRSRNVVNGIASVLSEINGGLERFGAAFSDVICNCDGLFLSPDVSSIFQSIDLDWIWFRCAIEAAETLANPTATAEEKREAWDNIIHITQEVSDTSACKALDVAQILLQPGCKSVSFKKIRDYLRKAVNRIERRAYVNERRRLRRHLWVEDPTLAPALPRVEIGHGLVVSHDFETMQMGADLNEDQSLILHARFDQLIETDVAEFLGWDSKRLERTQKSLEAGRTHGRKLRRFAQSYLQPSRRTPFY